MNIFELLSSALRYDPGHPLIFTDGLFLILFSLFLTVYAFVWKKDVVRTLLLIGFGFLFYYLASGEFLLLLLITISLDYLFSKLLEKSDHQNTRKGWLGLGVLFSLSFLIYFKYKNFFLESYSDLTGQQVTLSALLLPIGISFYTFQSISYLVDVYQKKVRVPDFHDYLLYMTFFPHLVAGPIVRARDFLPQLESKPVINMSNLNEGLFLITKGFIKKAVVADHVSQYSDAAFSAPASFSGIEHVFATLCYTLQIYCDFSGYTDMAIGIALVLGYRLCLNFDSPYKATDITSFWRKWHISLSSWLRDYLYIPLGGNKKGFAPQMLFLLVTMLIGGFWHGASWKFVFWGAGHGALLVLHKLWMKYIGLHVRGNITNLAGWALTFTCVALLWIPFRAHSFSDAMMIYQSIFSYSDPAVLAEIWFVNPVLCSICILAMVVLLLPYKVKFAYTEWYSKAPVWSKFVLLAVAIQVSIQLTDSEVQPFIYFQF
jgi:D-alanyl-lipoteichoic acid acyltransferase DltB (MBOAT superfamily)